MCKGHEKRYKGLRIFQNFNAPCTTSCGPCTKLYCVSLVWPLHTSEALAPLLVALAHIQVALAPNSICQICLSGMYFFPVCLFTTLFFFECLFCFLFTLAWPFEPHSQLETSYFSKAPSIYLTMG